MKTALIAKIAVAGLLATAMQATPKDAFAAWSKGRYGATNMKFSMWNKKFRCDRFSVSPIEQDAHVAMNQTAAFSWWATCTSGANTIKIDVRFDVTGADWSLAGGTGPGAVRIVRTAKLSYNGTTCQNRVNTYSWNLSNSLSSWMNQETTNVGLSGCGGVNGNISYNDVIGGMDP
jgi:hypothetical protein